LTDPGLNVTVPSDVENVRFGVVLTS